MRMVVAAQDVVTPAPVASRVDVSLRVEETEKGLKERRPGEDDLQR
jgi:hypothetical protein